MRMGPTSTRASQRAFSELARSGDIRLTPLLALVVGAGIGIAAVLLEALVLEFVGEPGYILLLAAVIVAAWIGGRVAGLAALVTTVIAVILHAWLFTEPFAASIAVGSGGLLRLIVYVVAAIGTVLVIGSRRAARDRLEDALRESASLARAVEVREENLEFVLEASHTGLWEWDVDSGALEWSNSIFRSHGVKPGELAPNYEAYLEMVHPEDVDRFRTAIDEAFATSTGFDLEFRVVWPDGSVHWTRGAGRVIREREGRGQRMLGTGQDITEQRKLQLERDQLVEDERRAREFRDGFMDVISHELRTPITTIFGMAHLLNRSDQPEDPVNHAGLPADIEAEAERLRLLVEDLLVLGRVEGGRLEVDTEPVNLRRVLTHATALEAERSPSIDIGLEIEPDLPIVSGEPTYVQQVVHNLLDNAAKYTPPGTRVTVSASIQDAEVLVRVIDEGPGTLRCCHRSPLRPVLSGPRECPESHGIRHRALHLLEPGPRHGRSDLGPSKVRGWVRVRVQPPSHPHRK